LGAVIVVTAVLAASSGIAAAASWSVALQSASSGQGQSEPVPSAPTGPTATCVSGTSATVGVGWTAGAHAASYGIYASTSGATGTYTLLQSGVTANPDTTTTLSQGTYYVEIVVLVGANWTSGKSVATTGRTIRNSGTRCA